MAFVVEDGTGLDSSNAFCTVAFCNGYFADRGIEAWDDLGQEEKENAIIKATDYVNYNFEFKGWKLKKYQSLEFPRDGLIEFQDLMPKPLLMATAEYALRARLDNQLQADPAYDPTGRVVTESKRKLEGLETVNKFSDYDDPVKIRAYPKADSLLSPLLANFGNVHFLIR